MAKTTAVRPWSAYANDPLEAGFSHHLVPQLREYLRERLPEYMVPSAWIVLKQLPLTPNGKVDRRALPAQEGRPEEMGEYIEPRTEVERTLTEIWAQLLRVDKVGVQDNFFELGGHSMLAMKALFVINKHFGSALKAIDLYESPTVRELAERIRGGKPTQQFVELSKEAELDETIVARPGIVRIPPKAVLLTGAAGFVGRFLMVQLLRDTDATVYCLVRARSAQSALSRLKATLSKWDLWRDEFAHRIVPVAGDLSLPYLGVDDPTYQELSQSIDSIYHCGTSMNHLETYAMAKSANVEGVKELVKLATRAAPKQINYISSVGIFSTCDADTNRIVDEHSPIDHEKHLTSRGYAASKWVGEKICMIAAERGIPCNIFRLGLVWADTQLGRYDELQWGYRIIKSSLLSGYGIKNYPHDMSPMPVDYVARAVVFLASRHSGGGGIFHLAASKHMDEGVFERCARIADTSLELLSLNDWLREIKRLHDEGLTLPALPLIDLSVSADGATLPKHQHDLESATVRFDCDRTHRELEDAGIAVPVVNDNLIRACLDSMLTRDADMQRFRLRQDAHALPLEERSLDP